MTWFQGLFLGIVQGLTEFLPVSSSGHLTILYYLLNIDEGGLGFSVMLHFATLLSVCICYRKTLWELLKHPFQKYTLYLIIGMVPAGLAGLLLNDVFEPVFQSVWVAAIALLVTAALLIVADTKHGDIAKDDLTWKIALLIGIAQIFALTPGISRSGATICMALLLGVRRTDAAEFSFIMSIPLILGSVLLEILDIIKEPVSFSFNPIMAVSFVAAAVFGVLAIKLVVRFLNKGHFRYFGYYCLCFSLLTITLLLLGL